MQPASASRSEHTWNLKNSLNSKACHISSWNIKIERRWIVKKLIITPGYSFGLSNSMASCHMAKSPAGSCQDAVVQWVETEWNWCAHFINKNLFPMSSGMSERTNERSGACKRSVQAERASEASSASGGANDKRMAKYSMHLFLSHLTHCAPYSNYRPKRVTTK